MCMSAHTYRHWKRIDHCFSGLIQVDGTEVTCQIASSQKSVTCNVGYPALKSKQQVEVPFHPQIHADPFPWLVLIHQWTIFLY